MELIKLLFSFNGRIGRQAYIITSIAAPIILAVITFVLILLFHCICYQVNTVVISENTHLVAPNSLMLPVLLPIFIVHTWIELALMVKRLHDVDKSGFWIFIAFVPVIGGIWLGILNWFIKGTDGPNQYGENPLQ